MRLSVTTLEQFNRFMNGEIKKDELIERLTTKFEGNAFTERGTRFHTIIENYDEINYSHSDYSFYEDQINSFVSDIKDYKQNGVPEVKGTKIYNFGDESVTLVGKADYYKGNSILELKTTSYYNAESYDNSIQWRAYMVIFGANEVVYKIATLKESNSMISIEKVDTLVKTYYEEIPDELQILIKMFLNFVKINNICLAN